MIRRATAVFIQPLADMVGSVVAIVVVVRADSASIVVVVVAGTGRGRSGAAVVRRFG